MRVCIGVEWKAWQNGDKAGIARFRFSMETKYTPMRELESVCTPATAYIERGTKAYYLYTCVWEYLTFRSEPHDYDYKVTKRELAVG